MAIVSEAPLEGDSYEIVARPPPLKPRMPTGPTACVSMMMVAAPFTKTTKTPPTL